MQKPSAKQISPPKQQSKDEPSNNKADTNNRLVELMQVMSAVNIETEEAKRNESSMPDNQGGRIIYHLTEEQVKELLRKRNHKEE